MFYRIRKILDNFMPDAFTIAFCLTILVIFFGWLIEGVTPINMVLFWYEGFWEFMVFTLQMAMMLVLGSSIANSGQVKKIIVKLSAKVSSPIKALYLIMLTTAVVTYFNWGIGAIIGPIIALSLKRRVKSINLPLFIAASYSSFTVIMPMSISVAAPLLVNTPGHFLEEEIGIVSFSKTIFAPTAVLTGISAFTIIVLLYHYLVKKDKDNTAIFPSQQEEKINPLKNEKIKKETENSPFSLHNSKILAYFLSCCAFIAVVFVFLKSETRIDFNLINFILMFIGIFLYGSPKKYYQSFSENIHTVSGIILQFPFYAGIMGMMAGSGLIVTITKFIMSFSSNSTYPILIILTSSFINFFVPSNGGQWLIVGPLLVRVGLELNVPIGTVVNAFSYGTFTSNFLQPFWVLPVLALSGLSVKDIWSYCIISFVLFIITAIIGVSIFPISW